MARPKKLALESFPFSVEFFSDEKVIGIDGEFGSKGVLAMVLLMCAIYRSNGYFMHWNAQACVELSGETASISPELLNAVVLRLVKRGFFDRGLFNTAHVLTSKAIQRRYFAAVRRRASWHNALYVFPDVLADDARPKGSESTERIPTPPPADAQAPSIPEYIAPTHLIHSDSDRSDGSDPMPPLPISSSVEAEFLTMPDEQRFEFLLQQTPWVNSICRTYNITVDQLRERVGIFQRNCINEGKRHFYLHDMKAHFNRWCRMYSNTNNFTRSNNPDNEPTRQDRLSRRRPTDPSANRADDYTTTL
ncbi:DUF4373 domain-containing protein [Paramuribaculum intestinale]|uniref:DUF4373 domain-containing protein n=2 Tax=Paramuribaculum intestinale TaxID=2094151 RepID=UPI0025B525DD|nr:DUF4373 domain-containing protein [Paramuribaculum intestinale]